MYFFSFFLLHSMNPIPVVYQDNDFFIVDKPYDLKIQSHPKNPTEPSGKKKKKKYCTLQSLIL